MASAGKGRLRVLFLSQRFPLPMDTGGKIRTGKMLEHVQDDLDVTLISNVESPKDDPYLPEVKQLCADFHPVPWKETAKFSPAFYLRVLGRLGSSYPITVLNDYSRDLEGAVLSAVRRETYDLLICDFLQPSLNFEHVFGYPTLLFQHNVESVIPERHAAVARNPVFRLFWRSQARKMARYEQLACRRFSGVVTVSDADKRTLEDRFGARNVFAIPTGVDTEYFAPSETPEDDDTLIFTGSMDWLPNEDAILFFAREILGRIKRAVPKVKFRVVGRSPSRHLQKELSGIPEIEIVGWVSDVRPEIARATVYVIPLRIGGGTRIKAYEAMAMGKPVVSTSIGLEGLPVTDGRDVAIADGPDAFADAVIRLLKNRPEKERLGAAARAFVESNCSWHRAARTFSDICHEVAQPRSY